MRLSIAVLLSSQTLDCCLRADTPLLRQQNDARSFTKRLLNSLSRPTIGKLPSRCARSYANAISASFSTTTCSPSCSTNKLGSLKRSRRWTDFILRTSGSDFTGSSIHLSTATCSSFTGNVVVHGQRGLCRSHWFLRTTCTGGMH